jgi:hypothetical protein
MDITSPHGALNKNRKKTHTPSLLHPPHPKSIMNIALLTQAERLELLLYEPGTALMKWGPCAWHLTNWVAFSLQTTPEQVVEFIDRLFAILPCLICRSHAERYVREHPVPPKTKSLQQDWLVEFHNIVNEKTGVPGWTYEEVVAAESARSNTTREATLWHLFFALALSVPFLDAGAGDATALDHFVQSTLPVLSAKTRNDVQLFFTETGSSLGRLPSAIVRRLLELHNRTQLPLMTLRDVALRFGSRGTIKLLALPKEEEEELANILRDHVAVGKEVGLRIINRIQTSAGAASKQPPSQEESQMLRTEAERTDRQLSKWEQVKNLGSSDIRRPILGMPIWAIIICIVGIVVLAFALIVMGKHIMAIKKAEKRGVSLQSARAMHAVV